MIVLKAVTAHFTSDQLLPRGFALHTLPYWRCEFFNKVSEGKSHIRPTADQGTIILVQVAIYRRLRIGRYDHLDQSEAYDIK